MNPYSFLSKNRSPIPPPEEFEALKRELESVAEEFVEVKSEGRKRRRKAKEQPGKASQSDFDEARAVIEARRKQIAAEEVADKTLFPSLSLSSLLDDLESFMQDPNQTAFNFNSWYCGPAAALNVAINYDPLSFVVGVLELGIEGETRAFNRWNKLRLPKDLPLEGFLPGHSPADGILGTSLKHAENGLLKRLAKDDSKLEQGTFPWETDDLLRKLGIKSQKKRWYRPFGPKALENIEEAVAEGKIPIVFENHLISSGRVREDIFEKLGLHYIPIHYFKLEGDFITFRYWDYARVKYEKIIHRDDFLKGMKGYWIPRNKKRN